MGKLLYLECMIYTGYYSKVKKYQEAGLKAISISVTEPMSIKVDGKIPELAPNQDLFKRYKIGNIDEMEYTSIYMDQLDAIGIRDILLKIHQYGDDVILLCWEAPKRFCHRHILANYISRNSKLEVKEYE